MRIVFYRLSAKFLERQEDVPKSAKNVVYHALAIGHHVGVFDCFEPVLRCSGELWERLLAALPEGEARRKLAGIDRFGEITIDRTHTALLGRALEEARPCFDDEMTAWSDGLQASLAAIELEPAIYLMGRKLP